MTVSPPFEATPKADKPRWGVTVKRGDFVDHHYFECADGSPSSKADTLAEANRFYREQLKKETLT